MTTNELYLNDGLLDLSDDTLIANTFQANNIAELQDRQGDFTNQFQVPKTKRNRVELENLHIVNSSTDLPYRVSGARYVEDGVEIVREGEMRIISSNAKSYVLQVNSGNSSFFGKFPDMKVSELIGNSLDHLNTFTNILGSRTNTAGYIYPLINWDAAQITSAFTDGEVKMQNLLPVIFIKDVFELTDQYTGFNSTGAFKALPDFENLVLTPNALQRGKDAQDQYNASAVNTYDQTFLIGVNNGTTTSVNYSPILNDYDGNFSGNLFTADAGLYGYFVFSGGLELKYKRYEFQQRIVVVKCQLIKTVGSVVVAEQVVFTQLTALDPAELEIAVPLSFSVITSNLTFAAGETYFVRVRVEDTLKSECAVLPSEFRFNLVTSIPYGGFMPVGELYETITVKQVYQDVMNMYAVLPQSNSFHGTIDFGLFKELSDNLGIAPDWSNKLQPDMDHTLTYKFGKYGKTNLMKYQATETVSNGYGDSSFQVDDQTLPDIVTAIELSTSATQDDVRFQNEIYPAIKALDLTTRAFTPANHRILLLNRKNVGYSHLYTDSDGEAEAVSTAVPYVTFRPLAFDVLKEKYYGTLLSMLFRTKAPSYWFKLDRQDIQELNYLLPIYLNVHQGEVDVTGYFYVNRISNYLGGFGRTDLVRLF